MIAETTAYKLLSNDDKLNELFDSYRGGKFGHGFKQGIFTYDIPEKPTDLKKKDLAPFCVLTQLMMRLAIMPMIAILAQSSGLSLISGVKQLLNRKQL